MEKFFFSTPHYLVIVICLLFTFILEKGGNRQKYQSTFIQAYTHTSLLIEANVHTKEIQERLGHSDIKIIMDIDTYMTKNMKRQQKNSPCLWMI